MLGYCPVDPTEVELRKRFAKIGVEGGKTFDPAKLSPEMKTAIEQGRAEAWEAFARDAKELEDGKITAGDAFGTRNFLKDNYLYRWLATIGIYGTAASGSGELQPRQGDGEAVRDRWDAVAAGSRLEGAPYWGRPFHSFAGGSDVASLSQRW